MIPARTIQKMALKAGFDLSAITTEENLEADEKYFKEWIQKGYAGEMGYMTRSPNKRSRPKDILPSTKSVIVLGLNYYTEDEPIESNPMDPNEINGRISRYAWGKDYHLVIEERIQILEKELKTEWGKEVETKWYVDYGPVLEKAFAQRAGLGFIGKNTLLITKTFGSWVFLSVLLTNLIIEPDQPEINHCGSCRLCLDYCPTGALVQPFQLDARKCISYQTIENKGNIDPSVRSQIGDWIFGCDECQTICPFNNAPVPSNEEVWKPSEGAGAFLSIKKLFAQRTNAEFRQHFSQSPLLRPKQQGLLRNAAVVLENHGSPEGTSLAQKALHQEPDERVRAHLAWAKGSSITANPKSQYEKEANKNARKS